MAAISSDDHYSASSFGVGLRCTSSSRWRDESACSTPFVSAPSSPDRDPPPPPFSSAASCFYSAAASPARGSGGCGGGGSGAATNEYGRGDRGGFDFDCRDLDFDFATRCPSPAAWAMSSADELFHNGQIRPMRQRHEASSSSFLLSPQALPPLSRDAVVPPPPQPPTSEEPDHDDDDERGRLRTRSARRRYRSLSPFRAGRRWLSPAPAKSVEPPSSGKTAPLALRWSSSSASTASSSASSSSPRSHRWWGFLKVILQRSKSDGGGGGKRPPPLSSDPPPPPPPAPALRSKFRSFSPSPSSSPAARGRGRARRAAHVRMYEAGRRADAAEETIMRRRSTFLPYRRQVFLLGYLGIGSRDYYGALDGGVA